MALGESDRLSLLALIVAIVALIVSGWQLAQQLFATAADGKRFCQASVMGVWARKTRLSWRWSQIRFETKYTTPEIRFTSGIARQDVDDKPSVWYRIPIIQWLVEVSLGPTSDWGKYFEVTSDRNDVPLELRKTRQPGTDISCRSSADKWSLWVLSWWDGSYKSDSTDVVSWPKLLERLYINQVHSIPAPSPKLTKDTIEPASDKTLENGRVSVDSQAPRTDMTATERELMKEDRVMVKLIERSWDLVPPDVVRPLAHSTVGTMVTIAHRLGMSWLGDFHPNAGQMNASGCGHTFTSESVRGLGLVLQYTYHQESEKVKNAVGARRGIGYGEILAPTPTADKLHCGILVIDPQATQEGVNLQDICLVDSARKMDMAALLNRLDVSGAEHDILRNNKNLNSYGAPQRWLKHAVEDAVSMLCPIPTLPNSQARWVTWPFRAAGQPVCPMAQWFGLTSLKDHLEQYLTSHKEAAKAMENRTTVLKYLDGSPLQLLDEIANTIGAINASRKHKQHDQQMIDKMYARLRSIHECTSNVFAKILPPSSTSPLPDDDEEPLPFILVLVGAHVALAAKHASAADDAVHFQDTQSADGSRRTERENRRHFTQEIARLYVRDLAERQEWTVRKHVRRAGYTDLIEPGIIPALWWTLVVRSACWYASVRIRLPESQISSFWYNSQMPVYIT